MTMRVAACADVHCRVGDDSRVRSMFHTVRDKADVLIVAGDLTDHGTSEEAEAFVHGVADAGVPVVTVLGNHDHESGESGAVVRILEDAGITCLDRSSRVIDDVGFVGVKGFGGGFENRILRPFGEDPLKAFIQEAANEAQALKSNLAELPTDRRVAVTHYSPVKATVDGESPEIYPFLGTSLLADAMDEGNARYGVHGHAHKGAFEGATPHGVPVRNVSIPVLRRMGSADWFHVFEV